MTRSIPVVEALVILTGSLALLGHIQAQAWVWVVSAVYLILGPLILLDASEIPGKWRLVGGISLSIIAISRVFAFMEGYAWHWIPDAISHGLLAWAVYRHAPTSKLVIEGRPA